MVTKTGLTSASHVVVPRYVMRSDMIPSYEYSYIIVERAGCNEAPSANFDAQQARRKFLGTGKDLLS